MIGVGQYKYGFRSVIDYIKRFQRKVVKMTLIYNNFIFNNSTSCGCNRVDWCNLVVMTRKEKCGKRFWETIEI